MKTKAHELERFKRGVIKDIILHINLKGKMDKDKQMVFKMDPDRTLYRSGASNGYMQVHEVDYNRQVGFDEMGVEQLVNLYEKLQEDPLPESIREMKLGKEYAEPLIQALCNFQEEEVYAEDYGEGGYGQQFLVVNYGEGEFERIKTFMYVADRECISYMICIYDSDSLDQTLKAK